MRISKIFLFLCIALFSAAPYTYGTLNANASKSSIEAPIPGGGNIIMADYIIALTLNDVNDNITAIQILDADGQVVYDEESCGSYHCTHNLSSLESGNYTVTVFTEKNDTFSGGIKI